MHKSNARRRSLDEFNSEEFGLSRRQVAGDIPQETAYTKTSDYMNLAQ